MNELTPGKRAAANLLGEAYAVRAIGDYGLDIFCLTVTAAGPSQALESAMETYGPGAGITRCWVVTRLKVR